MVFAIHESAIGTHMFPPLNPLLPTFLPMLSLHIVTEQQRGLCFDQVQCIYFFLFLSVLLSNKSLPSPVSQSFPMFSCKYHIVLGFTFRYLIHFGLIFCIWCLHTHFFWMFPTYTRGNAKSFKKEISIFFPLGF